MANKVEKNKTSGDKQRGEMVFGKENYKWILIGLGTLILGYILMTGTENIFSFRKITLAPIVILSGFVVIMFGIMKKRQTS